jgi:hypothetical protein
MKHIKVGTLNSEVIKRVNAELSKDATIEVAVGHRAILCENNKVKLDDNGQEIIYGSGQNVIGKKRWFDKNAAVSCQIFCFDESKEHTYAWGVGELNYMENLLGDYPSVLGANGEFGFKVKNGLKAIENLSAYQTFTVEDVKRKLSSTINDIVKVELSLVLEVISAFKLDSHRQQIADMVMERLSPRFEQYGLRLTMFNIAGFTDLDKGLSEEDKAKVKNINMAKYEHDKLKEVLADLAKKQLDEQAFLMQLAKTQNKGDKK